MTGSAPGPRHPRCGGKWRGPLSTDDGDVLVCNTCGDQRPAVARYLSRGEVAARLGVAPGTLSRYRLPAPDAVIGDTRGWLPETVDAWHAQRPGRGARTDLRR